MLDLLQNLGGYLKATWRLPVGYLNYEVIWSQKFISSQSKLSLQSKKLFNESCEGEQPKEGYWIKGQNYAVIWSQKFISSQSKLSIYSKKFFNKNFKGKQPKKGYEIKSQNYAVIWSEKFISSQSKLSM